MYRKIASTTFLLVLMTFSAVAADFDTFFMDKTMRVDYYHTGIKGEEIISLDAVYEEPACALLGKQLWSGSKVNLIDTLNLGKYLLKVIDTRTNQMIYSRGFCSIFGEWQTTEEAANGIYRSFHESVLLPYPKRQVQVIIANRDKYNKFYDIFSTTIDPESRFVNRESHVGNLKSAKIMYNGDPSVKVDIVILGDGYAEAEMDRFRERVRHYTKLLFTEEPFKSRKSDFNIWSVEVPSIDSGIDQPRQNIWKNNALGCSYNSMDSPRYVLTYENEAIRNIASAVPYDQIYILVNSNRYGGGGIYNLYSTCYDKDEGEQTSWWSDYVFVHEFGHAFGGLGDEYYTSDVAYSEFYPQGVDPWEPNVGIVANGTVKWASMIKKGIPVPTPWQKSLYDSLSTAIHNLDRSRSDYADQQKQISEQMHELLRDQKYWNHVGAFEGSGYASEGLYRPYLDCRMFSKSLTGFCPVCAKSIETVIDFYTR
ncbi:peptidase M64 [candidate division KSB1 bacterium]|nr:peptidase M64 [candidate division KSB1 bacterium]